MKRLLLSLACVLITATIFSANLTATQSGNWGTSSTWGGAIPNDGDNVTVPSGITVTVDGHYGSYAGMVINVLGVLHFENGKKIDMDNDGVVNLYSGGSLTAVNGGSKLRIGNNDVYVGPTTLTGPKKLTSSGVSLPVELTAFNAKAESNLVVLRWTTATEVNNDYFTIQRSVDGKRFEDVGRVEGAGTSSVALAYSFIDTKPLSGTSYYRLKQTDNDSKFEYFNVVAISMNKNVDLSIFPNPSRGGAVGIQFTALEDEVVTINILDLTGKEISNTVITAVDGVNVFNLDANLASGTYLVKTINKESVATKRLVVE